jgi:hypothetical protein
MMSSLWVSPSEGAHIDVLMSNDPVTEEPITDEVYTFADALSGKAEEGEFKMSIGSTYAPDSTLLTVTSDDDWSDDQSEEPEESEEDQWGDMEDMIDFAMASATAIFASGVSPEHLSKIWRISHEDAQRTLENTSHLLQRTTNPELSRNYGTNDRKYWKHWNMLLPTTSRRDLLLRKSTVIENFSLSSWRLSGTVRFWLT